MFAQRKNDCVYGTTADLSLTASSSATSVAPNASSRQQSSIATVEPLASLIARIASLARLPDNWDGNGSLAPTRAIQNKADDFLRYAFDEAICAGSWSAPLLSPSEDGALVFEWWNFPRKLTVYVSGHEMSYVKSWGPDVTSDMDDGPMEQRDIRNLLNWLLGWE